MQQMKIRHFIQNYGKLRTNELKYSADTFYKNGAIGDGNSIGRQLKYSYQSIRLSVAQWLRQLISFGSIHLHESVTTVKIIWNHSISHRDILSTMNRKWIPKRMNLPFACRFFLSYRNNFKEFIRFSVCFLLFSIQLLSLMFSFLIRNFILATV